MVLLCVFILSLFDIFWAMVGYPLFLKVLADRCENHPVKDYGYEPTISLVIVAHNEENVIENKLLNAIELDYPNEKLEIIVASDFSTDDTNAIVEEFILKNPSRNIRLYCAKEHLGKTNVQNEVAKNIKSEITVFSDANSIFEKNAIRELISYFTDDDIVYVCGKLSYVNESENRTASSEGLYWRIELETRKRESDLQTITAGNGAIYAVRTKMYRDIKPIQCHDSQWPIEYGLDGKRCLYNPDAIAYEKAGETDSDEFKRKVRMNREILGHILPSLKILNVIKYKWFSFFYLGHRTARYLLWLAHPLLFISSLFLSKKYKSMNIILIFQVIVYIFAFVGKTSRSGMKVFKIPYYYCMTVVAQVVGIKNIIFRKTSATWDKAESTR